jgi:Ca2+-binding RTX toxin-like protein
VADLAGNAGTGTTDSNNYAVDTARPTATIVVAETALTAGETSQVTVTFSEAVSGFTTADLTVANGALSAVASSDGGTTWTTTLTPSASVTDATNLITLANTGVADLAGNAGTGTTDSNNYAVDTVRPTATIVVADNTLSVGESSLVTVTFSEAVTGFSNADLTVENGALSAVASSDGGITWTATLTPSASVTDATNLITLDNAGVANTAGNAGAGATSSNNNAIDTTVTPPTSEPEPVTPVQIAGSTGADTIAGNDQNNLIDGGAGADSVAGGVGADTVQGGEGGDVLQGNSGMDSLSGGVGADVVLGGKDNDHLQGNAQNDLLSGDNGDDTVLGGQDDDTVQGGIGADYVSGDKGDDFVRGGQGDDVVIGGDGDDFVSGDLGSDTLTGGAGADIFHSFGAAGLDRVIDFNLAQGDRVMLDPGTTFTLAQLGADTVITMGGGGQVILANVQLATLSGDWIFGA